MSASDPAVYDGITYVIPCGGKKLDRPARAADLYIGSMFRHTLDNVLRCADMDRAAGRDARVLILSGRHGLVELDTIIAPYEQRIDQPGAVTADTIREQALTLGIDWGCGGVYALLPRPYLARLDEALRPLDVYPQDVYEAATGGNGEQKRINVHIGRPELAPAVPDGPGPTVWVGADVHGFWWGMPILVSYGRLRRAKTLPVASAPWVCDSRAFTELAEHGRWTISPEQYVADLRRYADEIGHMQWAAPQDWPAGRAVLDATGLTEHQHQVRTIESVKLLRKLAPELPIVCVVTAETPAGYLRHVQMYREAGIDLAREQLPVGVGALVKRPADEAAEIIRSLHSAGLERLHGFGIKGPVLALVGPLLESIDSAGWSFDARFHGETDRCPHHLTEWERNCPMAAREWAAALSASAASVNVQPHLPLFAAV